SAQLGHSASRVSYTGEVVRSVYLSLCSVARYQTKANVPETNRTIHASDRSARWRGVAGCPSSALGRVTCAEALAPSEESRMRRAEIVEGSSGGRRNRRGA